MDFTFKIYLPTQQRYARFKQIDNSVYSTIVKYIENNDNEYTLKCFNDIISTHIVNDDIDKLNKIDMFCVLLNLRILCISDTLDITYNTEHAGEKISQKIHINLYDILDRVTNYDIDYDFVYQVTPECRLTLKPPLHMLYDSGEDVLTSVIDDLYIGDKKYRLSKYTESQKSTIIDKLPNLTIKNIINYIRTVDTKYKINVFDIGTALQAAGVNGTTDREYELRMFDSSFYEFIKLCYSDSLQNIYYTRYVMTKHLGYTQASLESMTPQDLNTYITMYKKELDDERKAMEKRTSGTQGSMTLPNPGIGEQL